MLLNSGEQKKEWRTFGNLYDLLRGREEELKREEKTPTKLEMAVKET